MTNILLNDGEIVTISSKEDAIDIIGEKISYELSNYLRNHIVDADVEYEQYCEYMNKLEHDVNAYVMENDKLQKENEKFSRKISDLEFELKYLKEKTETEESFLPF